MLNRSVGRGCAMRAFTRERRRVGRVGIQSAISLVVQHNGACARERWWVGAIGVEPTTTIQDTMIIRSLGKSVIGSGLAAAMTWLASCTGPSP